MTHGKRLCGLIVLCGTIAAGKPVPQPLVRGTGLQLLDATAYQALPEALTPLGGQLPSSFDLSSAFQGFVGDQGAQESCVGWALSYCLGYEEAQERGWSPVAPTYLFSPSFIYNQSTTRIGTACGAVKVTKAAEVVKKGAALLSAFPYDSTDCTRMPTRTELQAASPYRVDDVDRVPATVEALKGFLAGATPVIVGFSVLQDFRDLRGNGVYDNVTVGGQPHALVITGYDDAKGPGGAFRVINSWGTSWADSGFAWVSYRAFRSHVSQAYYVEPHDASHPPMPMVYGTGNDVAITIRFTRDVTYDGDTVVTAARVILGAGVTIRVRHGSRFEIKAAQILVEGTATIDGTGDVGHPGRDAIERGLAEWSSRTDFDYWSARRDIESNVAHPDRGTRGGDGGVGGKGATVILAHHPAQGVLVVKRAGGAGGPGGRGSHGRLIKNGRNFYCNGCMYQNVGTEGATGPTGPDGTVQYLDGP